MKVVLAVCSHAKSFFFFFFLFESRTKAFGHEELLSSTGGGLGFFNAISGVLLQQRS